MLTNKMITDILNSYIDGVDEDRGQIPDSINIGAQFFDWETAGDVRNSLRELREVLIKANQGF